MTWALETSMPTLSDTPPPIRPHLLVLPKQFHRLGPKHSSLQAFGGHLYSNTKQLNGERARLLDTGGILETRVPLSY